jgi:hypothetical protein
MFLVSPYFRFTSPKYDTHLDFYIKEKEYLSFFLSTFALEGRKTKEKSLNSLAINS